MTDKVEILSWSSDLFDRHTELMGTGAAHLFAEIDQPATNEIDRTRSTSPGWSCRSRSPTDQWRVARHRLGQLASSPSNPMSQCSP